MTNSNQLEIKASMTQTLIWLGIAAVVIVVVAYFHRVASKHAAPA